VALAAQNWSRLKDRVLKVTHIIKAFSFRFI
jgi:hypothetical protein